MARIPSMYSGVSGLTSQGEALSTVADNIANMNTDGFKGSRVNFGDIMVQSLTSGGGLSTQIGTGSMVLNTQAAMTQGTLETTRVSTDMAINGPRGFFGVRQVSTAAANSGGASSGTLYYTRAGQFLLDKQGYLVNDSGLRLQGYNVDANNNLVQVPADLRIVTQQSNAVPTTEVDMSLNLNASDTKEFAHTTSINPSDSTSYNFSSNSTQVYDSLGVAHTVTMYYQKLSDMPNVISDGHLLHLAGGHV